MTIISKIRHYFRVRKAKKSLSKMDRRDLLNRRAILELAISQAGKKGLDWTARLKNGRLCVQEQYEFINDALKGTSPHPPIVIGLNSAEVKLRTFKQGD